MNGEKTGSKAFTAEDAEERRVNLYFFAFTLRPLRTLR